MKKYILLLFIVVSSLLKAQTYTFDNVLTYESTTKLENSTVKNMYHFAINSTNSSYILTITNGYGSINNFEKNERYLFSYKVMDDRNLDFNYLETRKIIENKKSHYYNSKLNENGEFKFQTFTNRKKSKVKNEVVMKLREAPFNLLYVGGDHIYQEEKLLLSQLQSSLDSTKSYIMESIEIHHTNGYIFNCNFVRSEKFNLEIKVPLNQLK